MLRNKPLIIKIAAIGFPLVCLFALLIVCFFHNYQSTFYSYSSIVFGYTMDEKPKEQIVNYLETEEYKNEFDKKISTCEGYYSDHPADFTCFDYEWVTETNKTVFNAIYTSADNSNIGLFCEVTVSVLFNRLTELGVPSENSRVVTNNNNIFKKTYNDLEVPTYIVFSISFIPILLYLTFETISFIKTKKEEKKEIC